MTFGKLTFNISEKINKALVKIDNEEGGDYPIADLADEVIELREGLMFFPPLVLQKCTDGNTEVQFASPDGEDIFLWYCSESEALQIIEQGGRISGQTNNA